MSDVNVTELRQHLPAYLARVRKGECLRVTSRGKVIADGRVVSNFIVQALSNEPLTVYGDDSQTRSFEYSDHRNGGFHRRSHRPPTL